MSTDPEIERGQTMRNAEKHRKLTFVLTLPLLRIRTTPPQRYLETRACNKAFAATVTQSVGLHGSALRAIFDQPDLDSPHRDPRAGRDTQLR